MEKYQGVAITDGGNDGNETESDLEQGFCFEARLIHSQKKSLIMLRHYHLSATQFWNS